MASSEWSPFDVARGVDCSFLASVDSTKLIDRISRGLPERRGVSVAGAKEAQHARVIPLVLACGSCESPTAGVLADGSLATFLPDSYTDDAIRLSESGWLSRFSSTMGASGDFTMPTMPIVCPACGVAVPVEGSLLYAIWNSVDAGDTVAIALKRS
jgi:hypothetical protein